MGNLKFFDIGKYKGFDTFIETGTGKGLSIDYINSFNFKAIYSIECVDSLYQETRERFKGIENVHILKGTSWRILESILRTMQLCRCIFWLDAHLPGVDYKLAGWFDEKDPEIRMPLVKELETIKNMREGRDVILIDDLRFYTKDNFENGNLPDDLISDGFNHILNMFERTHYIKKYMDNDGYLEMVPKLGGSDD